MVLEEEGENLEKSPEEQGELVWRTVGNYG
jgi:hypothetical protein